ncbi:unnamed protein product [Tuber melanosporum]|uniref:(Perigord truffle) hypothetical protein n=1 Tax=Tuber melanosporum (strain Mel28) TaxID=656061 RepID=D5G734_TUBMM|nr:uncharacterized protein GSTUM_00002322001 [Tuber melanosporum]CAZ80327.1 unnamed protein product [Tuber melanosporum]
MLRTLHLAHFQLPLILALNSTLATVKMLAVVIPGYSLGAQKTDIILLTHEIVTLYSTPSSLLAGSHTGWFPIVRMTWTLSGSGRKSASKNYTETTMERNSDN